MNEREAALTKEELNRLPDGTRILVTWSGGNGPHRYVLRFKHGAAFAVTDFGRGEDPVSEHLVLNFVGAHPLTQVWIDSEVR